MLIYTLNSSLLSIKNVRLLKSSVSLLIVFAIKYEINQFFLYLIIQISIIFCLFNVSFLFSSVSFVSFSIGWLKLLANSSETSLSNIKPFYLNTNSLQASSTSGQISELLLKLEQDLSRSLLGMKWITAASNTIKNEKIFNS